MAQLHAGAVPLKVGSLSKPSQSVSDVPSLGTLAAVLALGYLLATASIQSWLMSPELATGFMSRVSYESLMMWLEVPAPGENSSRAVSWTLASGIVIAAMLCTLGAGVLRRDSAWRWWAWHCGLCWCALGAWEPTRVLIALSGVPLLGAVIEAIPPLWLAMCVAAGITSWWPRTDITGNVRPTRKLLLLTTVYVSVFVTMNWRLWFNLLIPHGDSSMYEEHLWNVLHGKGFRSYLDQGLFLGEHIQVVHLGLIPLYVLWPSHLLLEACESLALALGVFPIAWMTHRHTHSGRLVVCAAAAYLLYVPMQSLDIEIDLKTFRPEAFGIPLLLLTLDQLDRWNLWGFLLGLLACLTVKEDYAIIIGPIGLWILTTTVLARRGDAGHPLSLNEVGKSSNSVVSWRAWAIVGGTLMIFSVAYLWMATRVLIPWFRPGEEIHFARYFSRLGDSPEAIVSTFLFRPNLVLAEFITPQTVLYALMMILPVGGLALLSLGRLCVGLPLFGVLCLNELARDPRHHFHAPLVAIVFWAVAAGVGRLRDESQRYHAGNWLWSSALATGFFFSLSPFGLPFWDAGSAWHWQKLYGPSDRGAEFAKIAPLIPVTARVASTDFVHPRFTHHARSYDYSQYVRKVSGYEQRVPEDTDYIVIDTTHRYSTWKTPGDIPEFRDHPDQWELLTAPEGSAFIVLKRKR